MRIPSKLAWLLDHGFYSTYRTDWRRKREDADKYLQVAKKLDAIIRFTKLTPLQLSLDLTSTGLNFTIKGKLMSDRFLIDPGPNSRELEGVEIDDNIDRLIDPYIHIIPLLEYIQELRLSSGRLTNLDDLTDNDKLRSIKRAYIHRIRSTTEGQPICIRSLQNLQELRELKIINSEVCLQHLDLGRLKKLRKLSIILLDHHPTDEKYDVQPSIGNLTDLEELCLIGEWTDLSDEIGNLTNLKKLSISGRNLQIYQLPSYLKDMKKLKDLWISTTRIRSLSVELTHLSELEYLSLRNNKFELDTSKLPSTLKKLDLSINQLTEVPNKISRISDLRTLKLGGNQIEEITDDLTRLQELRTLKLGGNQIEEITDDLTRLQELKALSLRNNNLDHFPIKLGRLKNLLTLDLSKNRISELPEQYPGGFDRLETLNIGDNKLLEIPEWLIKLPSLKKLYTGTIDIPKHYYQIAQKKGTSIDQYYY